MSERDVGLTLSGGGIRSFYQLGMLRAWESWLAPRLASVAATSAGSCASMVFFAGRDSYAHALFEGRRNDIQRNFDWEKLKERQNPFPHEAVYRGVLKDVFDAEAVARIQNLPFPIWVLCARVPRQSRPLLSAMSGVTLAMLEHYWRGSHRPPQWALQAGFEPRVWDARTCEDGQEMIDLIVASSATPPMIEPGAFRGERLVDGFVINNTPSFVHEGRVALRKQIIIRNHPSDGLVSRPAPNVLSISPDYDFLSNQWDYSSGSPIDRVLAEGRRDAAVLYAEVQSFLAD